MLNVSIVLYNHSVEVISPLVMELNKSEQINDIFLVDNSSISKNGFKELPVKYIFNGKNLGYGVAHNIAIRQTIAHNIPYHLVLNPDVELDSAIFDNILDFMQKNPDVGHLMPKVLYPNGDIQYQIKLLPTPLDLFIRRFLPQKWLVRLKARFELRDSGYNKIMQVPYLSGCFMFLRTKALEDVGLFDERFFLYPEDIDLTRRIHQKYKTFYYPLVSIVHYHTKASYKDTKLLLIHILNIIKYFNKWGWFFDKERKRVNKATLKMLNSL